MFDWLRKEHPGKGEPRLSVVKKDELRRPSVHEFDPSKFETREAFLAHLEEKGAYSHNYNGQAHIHSKGKKHWDQAMVSREQVGWRDWPHEKLFAYIEERARKPNPVFAALLPATVVAWARGGIPKLHSDSYNTTEWPWEMAESLVARARQNLRIDAEVRRHVLLDANGDLPVYPEPWKAFRVKFEGSWYVVFAISQGLSAGGMCTYFGLNNRPLITFGPRQWAAVLPEGTTP